MSGRGLQCVFVDDVDLSSGENLTFLSPERDVLLLDQPGLSEELCICVTASAQTSAPMRKLSLSLFAHGREIDWITYEDAAVRPPEKWHYKQYFVDHIFVIPHSMTYRQCRFVVTARTEHGHLGARELLLEFPLPF